MPKGARERFFVELVPGYDQKKLWELLSSQARDLESFFRGEIGRQTEVLGAPMAKSLYLGSKGGEEVAPDLVEPARSGIKSQAHDKFRPGVKGRRSAELYLELRPEDVVFSVETMAVRVPYLGVVARRGNNKILPGSGSENAGWLMGHVTSMALATHNRCLCLVIDTREDPSRKTKKPRTRPKGKTSKWLE